MVASRVYLFWVRLKPARAFVVKSGVRPERVGWDLNPPKPKHTQRRGDTTHTHAHTFLDERYIRELRNGTQIIPIVTNIPKIMIIKPTNW
jgi:hypothetical protein